MPRKKETLWFVVADSARAKFWSFDHEEARLTSAGRGMVSRQAPITTGDVKSGIRHSGESRHDPHKMAKHKLILALAETLEAALLAKTFSQLVLVAPRRSLGEMRAVLSDRVLACIKQEVPKDLTKHSTAELRQQLEPIARRVAFGLEA